MANLSVDQLRPCPTGRGFFLNAFQAANCLATITGPSGTKPSPRPVHKICSTSIALQPRTFEDEDEDDLHIGLLRWSGRPPGEIQAPGKQKEEQYDRQQFTRWLPACARW